MRELWGDVPTPRSAPADFAAKVLATGTDHGGEVPGLREAEGPATPGLPEQPALHGMFKQACGEVQAVG